MMALMAKMLYITNLNKVRYNMKLQNELNKLDKQFRPKKTARVIYVQPKNGVYRQPKKESIGG